MSSKGGKEWNKLSIKKKDALGELSRIGSFGPSFPLFPRARL